MVFELKDWDLFPCHIAKLQTVVPHCKKPTAQTAHLVFADTQAKAQKNQKNCFLPTLDIIKIVPLRL